MTVEIVTVSFGSEFYYDALALRNLLLREPLGLSFTENDRLEDEGACHVVAIVKDRVVGCVVGVKKNDRVKIRQMVVHPELQRQGIGRLLLTQVEAVFIERGYFSFFLHARLESLEFYQKNGYEPQGDPFYEVGILHQVMVKLHSSNALPSTRH